MFRSARALDRAKTHQSFRTALSDYHKTAESWFDGSVGSIDRRLAKVDRLLHHIRATVARLDFGSSAAYLSAAQQLSADRKALVAQRADMLNGYADYRTANGFSDIPGTIGDAISNAPHNLGQMADTIGSAVENAPANVTRDIGQPISRALGGSLAGSDRRWVTLEAAKFVAANTDTLDDSDELATRAAHHAALHTSTFTPARSRAVTAAFVGAVEELGRAQYRPAVKKAAAVYQDFDPQAMFL
jgi:hypothetical protein